MDSTGLKIASLNCEGLHDRRKQVLVRDYCRAENINVLFLQETHINSEKLATDISTLFQCKIFWTFGTNRSRGCAICIFDNFDFKVDRFFRDFEGRLLYVDLTVGERFFRLLNVYCHNDDKDRAEFFQHCIQYLSTNKVIIFGGDMNSILNMQLDKVGGNDRSGLITAPIQRDILKNFDLVDIFRKKHPRKVITTYHGPNNISSRLDRFYISKSVESDVDVCSVIPFCMSDHDLIVIEFKNFTNVTFGRGYWKMNTSIFSDRAYRQAFREFCDQNIIEDVSLNWWDFFKEEVKKFTIKYCKQKSKIRRAVYQELRQEYEQISVSENVHPGQYTEQLLVLKKKILDFENSLLDGAKIRSKVNILENNEKPSRYFFQKEKDRGKKKTINRIVSDGVEFKTSPGIIDCFRKFYNSLFTSEGIDRRQAEFFLEDVPVLSEEDRDICEGYLTSEEILQALKQMDNNKSPGPDGIPKEFYLSFFDILGPVLVKVLNLAYDEQILSKSQRLSYISLLCKDTSQSENMKFWRPISLLCVDTKIISKVITNRVGQVIGKVVHKDQTCSCPGRSILDNNHLLRNIEAYVEQKDLECAFISLDQEKAFDRVEYDFMFMCLQKYGFGESLIRWIMVLYTDILSAVIVNNFISDPFRVTRGVRQGCSLSPLLYVLILEPFACKVRSDPSICGIKLPGSTDTAKLSMYADDSTAICVDDYSVEKVLYWCKRFGLASGSKLNMMKTKGMFLGKWKSRSDHPFGISWVDDIKLLGIRYGHDLTFDDVWHPLFQKVSKTLNLFSSRRLSLRGKATVINVSCLSKLWYVGSVLPINAHYIHVISKEVMNFFWKSTSEPLQRKVLYNDVTDGGQNLVCIKTKLESLLLCHIQKIVNGHDAKWVYFAKYWCGYKLRKFNPELASNSIPHSEIIPSFYSDCLALVDRLLRIDSDLEESFGTLTSSILYSTLLKEVKLDPRILRVFPTVDFGPIFCEIYRDFVDHVTSDVSWKVVHEILPINYVLYCRNISRDKSCPFCGGIETFEHLFFECRNVRLIVQYVANLVFNLSRGKVGLNFSQVRHTVIGKDDAPDNFVREVIYYLITELKYCIWMCRNCVKFDHKDFNDNAILLYFVSRVKDRISLDFSRFSLFNFIRYWCYDDIFCKVVDDKLEFIFA